MDVVEVSNYDKNDLINYTDDACILLKYQWGIIYTNLVKAIAEDNYTYFYVDDRADPKNFKNLLSWAHPEIAMKLYGKRYNCTETGAKYIRLRKYRVIIKMLKE